MDNQPLGPIAIFAAVVFVLTLLSGGGFFNAIGFTVVASAVFFFVSRWLASRKGGG